MTLVWVLILAPIALGTTLCFIRSDVIRRFAVVAVTLTVAFGTLGLLKAPGPIMEFPTVFPRSTVDAVMFVLEMGIAAYLGWVGLRDRKPGVFTLIIAQLAIGLWSEFSSGSVAHANTPLFIDKLSVLMAIINGWVGGGICVYALSYMRDYHAHAHRETPDRQPLFFGLLVAFLGAMFGLVFANDLRWIFFFWEITTLCSFLLIGYTGTAQARDNAHRALWMNLTGGLAFSIAIQWCQQNLGTCELQGLLHSQASLVMFPATLLCFAGIAKSAQLPFCPWLLGAMVAPTPVSALLHSSTMVKAGVYLVLRMAPVISGTKVGLMVALVGATTFLVGSLAAITTSDAKRVLAQSTVANLGLIVLCGGIGTDAAVWAGVLMIVFHAVSKCLLFLCVGVVEHRLHSRDIESMAGLIKRMPQVAVMMLIGMAGMFLAPFGMLISKWAVLKAVIDAYAPLSVFIVFGSAATLFFWVKWMGKLLEVLGLDSTPLPRLATGELTILYGLSGATLLTCLLFPVLSSHLIEVYVVSVYGRSASMASGNVLVMTLMMLMVLLFPVSFLNYGRGVRVTDAYLSGANLQSSLRFLGGANRPRDVGLSNYYLCGLLNEGWLAQWGAIASISFIAFMFVIAVL